MGLLKFTFPFTCCAPPSKQQGVKQVLMLSCCGRNTRAHTAKVWGRSLATQMPRRTIHKTSRLRRCQVPRGSTAVQGCSATRCARTFVLPGGATTGCCENEGKLAPVDGVCEFTADNVRRGFSSNLLIRCSHCRNQHTAAPWRTCSHVRGVTQGIHAHALCRLHCSFRHT